MQHHRERPHDDVWFQHVGERVNVALAPVVGVRAHANATIVVGDRHTAVIDTTFRPERAAAVRAEAERLGPGRPVHVVVLTHADPDHVMGLAAYGAPVVVGSAAAAAVLRDPVVTRAYAGSVQVAAFGAPESNVTRRRSA